MAEQLMLPEDAAPELAQDPTQAAPATAHGPPDYKAKRSKFLSKFAELDPEAKIDEPTLAGILADNQKRDEFTKYVSHLNPKFGLSGEELASELGYAANLKKKPGGNVGLLGGNASQVNPAQMQAALGIRPQDIGPNVGTTQPPPDADFSTKHVDFTPTVPVQGVGSPEALPTAEQYPAYLRAHPDQRAKLIDDEAKFLGQVPKGFERTRISDEAVGPDQPGTYQLENSPTGQRYIDRPLSKLANGKEQSEWEAAGANFQNQLLDMGLGGLDYLGAADRRLRASSVGQFADELGAKVGLNGNPNRGNVFQDGADELASRKAEVAPFHVQSKFSPGNPATYPMAASNVAALAAPALVSVLVPEGKVAQGLQAMAGLAFDSQMIEGSFARAKQAGLTPGSKEYDNYTLADATATMLVFKLGAVGLGAAQQQALKSQLLQDVGEQVRGVTGHLSEQALSQSMQRAAQRAAQTLKGAAHEGAQMGTLMASNTVKDKVGEHVANQQMGRAIFPEQSLSEDAADVGRSFGEGVALGGLTGGIRGAGQPVAPAANPRLRPFEGTKAVAADQPISQLRGRKVLTRDAQGHAQLGEVQDVVEAPEGRAFVVRNAESKLTRHMQGEVFVNDRTAQPTERTGSLPQSVVDKLPVPGGLQTLANAEVLTTPATSRRKIVPREAASDPGPTADNRPRRATPRPADDVTPPPTGGPTLGELVPDTTPVTLDFGGEPVQAFRNAEGDVELHHKAGNVSVISKGEAFDKPAVVSLLTRPQPRVKVGDTVTVGSGEFATEHPIEDVHRDQAGQITAVMVEGKTGSRIIEGDTPEGKAALAELNAREQQAGPGFWQNNFTSPAQSADSEQSAANQRKIAPIENAAPRPYGTPAENRQAGRFTKDGQTYTRQEPLAERTVTGKETTVHFATGEAQPARFALVEAADLQPSHTGGSQNLTHFLPEAQPKNRSNVFDKASQKAIDEIAAKPDAKQLADAPTAYAGAPVINGRGEVIQGNGRSEGIRQHYKQGGKTYRAEILAEAQRQGIDPKAGRAMKEPVLVRVADVSDARAQQLGSYTAADTESGGQRRLDVKQAAQRLTPDTRAELARILTPEGEGTLTETIRGKQAELVRFLQKNKLANATQLQTLVKADGTLTAQGVEDVAALHRQTLFADADPNLPELFQELPAAAQNGLDRAVGHLASLPEKDSILPELHAAIAGVREYRASGTDFATWAGQRDLYAAEGQSPNEKYNPLELKLIKLLAEERRPTYISRVFDEYARAVKGQEGDLFTGKPAVSRAEAITQTFNVDDKPRRNPSREESTPGRRAADGPPAAPEAPGMESPAKDAQRGTQFAAANPEQAGRPAGQKLAEGSPGAQREQALAKIRERRAQQPPTHVNEYTKAYPLRETEPASIRETGHAALKAAEKAGRRGKGQLLPGVGPDTGGRDPLPDGLSQPSSYRGKAEVSQLGISAEMREKGSAAIVGRVIRSVSQLAEAAQVMRDPRWETFKYYFVKSLPDGREEIVGERTMSARMPGTAPAFPSNVDGVKWLKEQMKNISADGYYCQHNHPSGHVHPSAPDIEYTRYIMSKVPGFRGHLIINHRKFTLLLEQGGELVGSLDNALPVKYHPTAGFGDPLRTPSKPGPLLGRKLNSAEDIAGVAKELEQKEGWAVIIGRGPDGRVQAAGHIPLATLMNLKPGAPGEMATFMPRPRAEAAIRSFARETGSPHVILAGLPDRAQLSAYTKKYGGAPVNMAHIGELIRHGVLLDAIDVSGKALSKHFKPTGRWIGPTPPPRVWESLAEYNSIPDDDLADYRTVLGSYTAEGTTGRKKLTERFRADVGTEAETGVSDGQLHGLIKEAQEAAGVVPKSQPEKALKDRRHATRYDEATRKAFTEDESRYAPKKLIDNADTAREYIHQVGLENAYAVAFDKPEGFPAAAHVEVQEAVAREFARLSSEARKAGNKQQAADYWQKSKDVRAKKVSALTEAAQTLAQVQGFVADDPHSVLDLAIRTTEAQRKPKLAKAEKDGAKVAAKAIRQRRRAMNDTLASEAVQTARERVVAPRDAAITDAAPAPEPKGYGASNKYFKKDAALAAREALRKLGLSTVVPPELVHFVGYHVEALARAGGKHSFAEVSKRVVRELGAKVKPMLPEAYERARKVYVKNGGKDEGFTSPADVAADVAPAAVKSGIKQLGTTLDKIAREQAEGVNMKGRTLAERFVQDAGLDPTRAKTFADAIEGEYTKQITARKKELAQRLITFGTRALMGRNAATAVDKLLTTLNLATDPHSAGELLKKQLNLPEVTPEIADHLTQLAEAVRTAKPGNERSDRVADLMKAVGKLEHVSWYDAAEAMWYGNVLSGPLTHAVNITSNAKQATAELVLSTLHTLAETGNPRAALAPALGAIKAQRKAIAEATRIISTGYTGTQSEKFGHNNVLENTDFKGAAAPLNGLKYVGRALAGEDAYFNVSLRGLRTEEVALKQAYREVRRDAHLNGEKPSMGELYARALADAQGKLFGIEGLRAAAESQTDAEGITDRKARLRRIGELVNAEVEKQQQRWYDQAEAEGLVGIEKTRRVGELQTQTQPADIVADTKQFAELATFNNPLEGTAGAVAALIGQLGNIPVGGARPFKLLAPFTRILSSVQNRRLDWSPVGILRAVKGSTGSRNYQGGRFHRELTPEQREKAFLSGTLGTVTTLGLYALARAGYVTITGTSFGDKDKKVVEPPASFRFGDSGLFLSYEGSVNELGFAAVGNVLDWEKKEAKAGRTVDPTHRLLVAAGLTAMYGASLGPTQGVADGLEALTGVAKNPDRAGSYAARLAAQTGKGLVPYSALASQTLKGLNILRGEAVKEQTERTAWEAAYSSLLVDVPIARDRQNDAVDLLGDTIKLSSTRIWGWLPERSPESQAALNFLAAHDLIPARSKATDPSLAQYDAATGKMRAMNGEEFYKFQVAKGKAFGDLLRSALRKPSADPALPENVRAVLRQHPEQDLALPDMDLKDARKWVSAMHKQAVKAGKEAIYGPAPTTPTK